MKILTGDFLLKLSSLCVIRSRRVTSMMGSLLNSSSMRKYLDKLYICLVFLYVTLKLKTQDLFIHALFWVVQICFINGIFSYSSVSVTALLSLSDLLLLLCTAAAASNASPGGSGVGLLVCQKFRSWDESCAVQPINTGPRRMRNHKCVSSRTLY